MKRIRTHVNPLSIYHRFEPLEVETLFPQCSGTIDCEIGFGKGVFLRHWAQAHPQHLVCGIEVRKPMVTHLKTVTANDFDNVQLFHGNGQHFVEDAISNDSLDRLFIFHPDPWVKKRHKKRRVLTSGFLDVLALKLKASGKCYISTDVDFLWVDMMETISAHAQFQVTDDDSFWESHYQSHWSVFSEQDQRPSFRVVIEKV